MKTKNKVQQIIIFILLTFCGCKKIELYQIEDFYLKNNTDDTLKVMCALGTTDTLQYNILKQKSLILLFPDNYYYFYIKYKNIVIRFRPDTLANNYKDNFFNLQDWEKTCQFGFGEEDEYGSKLLSNAILVEYYFQFDTLKIININEK